MNDLIIPRPFKLRLEYDAAVGKKSKTYIHGPHAEYISYGLHVMNKEQSENPKFDCVGYWNGIIIGAQGLQCGEIFYSFVIKIPTDYPYSPPIIRFVTKIVLSFVDSHGYVHVGAIPNYTWKPTDNIADILMAIRSCMHDRVSVEASFRVRDQTFFNVDEVNVERNFSN